MKSRIKNKMADLDAMFYMPVRHRNGRRQRVFAPRINPLETMSESDVYKRYRFSKDTIHYICDLLRPHLERRTRRSQYFSVEMQVLTTLRYLASGCFLEVAGDTLGVEKYTVSRMIQRVTAALVTLIPDKVRFPTVDERAEIKAGFHQMAGFPAVIGCIDGTHVRIQGPSVKEDVFVNRKGFHSINVQAVCDHKGRFINVVAKWPGSSHDSHIFNASQLKADLEDEPHRIQDGVVLGDSGYACKPYLLTPFLRPADAQEERYNVAHKATRCTIERTFGWWKRRFHILHGEVRMRPDRVCKIIGACAVLHNIAIDCHEAMEDGEVDGAADVHMAYNGPEEGRSIRHHIAHRYF